MIIDAHCHWTTPRQLDRYLQRARRAGIQRTVLFPMLGPDYESANREVGELVMSSPSRLLGFAFVHPRRDRGKVASIVRECVGRFGFCGVKVHRHDGVISSEVCEAAAADRIPVLYDPAGEVEVCASLARDYPHVDFIIPHLGSFADDLQVQLKFIDHLMRHENIYADTSGVRRFDLLVQAVGRAGPHKLLFGSDGPFLHPGLELSKVLALHLPPPAEELVLAGNLLRLIGRRRTDTAHAFAAASLASLHPVPVSPSSNHDSWLM